MGTTANHSLPYPESSDLVTNGAAAIQALAEALDTALVGEDWHTVGDTGEPAFANGWALGDGSALVQFRKDACGTVYLRGLLAVGTLGAAAFTLPAGYRPEQAARGITTVNGNGNAIIEVAPTGEVKPNNRVGSGWAIYGVDLSFSTRA